MNDDRHNDPRLDYEHDPLDFDAADRLCIGDCRLDDGWLRWRNGPKQFGPLGTQHLSEFVG